MKHEAKRWRYKVSTKTIRASPENYWVATMDSFEGAVNHFTNARLIAAAPELLAALENIYDAIEKNVMRLGMNLNPEMQKARAAITKAKGE